MNNQAEYSGADQPAYVWEMLKRPLNLNLGLGTLAAATFLAIPLGAAGFALPLLLFGAGEAIAAMFIPSSASFRVSVDREHAARRRAQTAAHLKDALTRRVGEQDSRWGVYDRLCERIASLREMARHRKSGLSEQDLLRLDDSAVDYLGLWLAEQSMIERQVAVDERNIERRIQENRLQIAAGAEDTRSLQKACADLEELLLRHRRLASRRAAVEAALLSLPDALDEIYDAVVTLPAGGEAGGRLQEAIDRLRLEEELENSYGAEIREIVPARLPRAGAAAGSPRAGAVAGDAAAEAPLPRAGAAPATETAAAARRAAGAGRAGANSAAAPGSTARSGPPPQPPAVVKPLSRK